MPNALPALSVFSDVLNAFIRAAAEDGDGDDHAFWSFCSSELHRLHSVHSDLADRAAGIEGTLRHRAIAATCDALASADADEQLLEDLRSCARSALARVPEAHGQGRAFLLAEFRLCMLAADADYGDFGTTREAFLEHLEQCAQPA